MVFVQESIREKIATIDALIEQVDGRKNVSVIDVLRGEILKLRRLNEEYMTVLDGKKVLHKDQQQSRTKYYLKDGSTYVVKGDQYRYLYDAKTKVITYEFPNGQIEKTFPWGLKEIRHPDGTITIKSEVGDRDIIK